MKKRKKIAVLMSGGVDSSVAALLLKKSDYSLIGIHLKVSRFCNPQDELDARLVAEKLNFPIYTLDISKDYQRIIALEMIKEYSQGFTPNPDIWCNSKIKFGLVLDFLKEIGVNYIATGHYAKIVNLDGENLITVPKDNVKDQTYFLWQIKRRYLKKIIFPLGDYSKTEVRQIAKEHNLPNADKKDSQGICFLGKIKVKDFLKEYLPINKGPIFDNYGNFLGYHPGYYFFTEGQRHGLEINSKPGPYYLAIKNPQKNILVVATANEDILFTQKIKLKNPNILISKKLWQKLNRNAEKMEIFIRCRYRQPLIKAVLNLNNNIIEFSQPVKAVALGQSAVFYFEGEKLSPVLREEMILLGGGIIIEKYN